MKYVRCYIMQEDFFSKDKDGKPIMEQIEVTIGVYKTVEEAQKELSEKYNWEDVLYRES